MPSSRTQVIESDRARVAGAHNGAGSDRVHEFQRARLVAAITEVCAEEGVANITVARVVARAGVSRRTFYDLFDDGEECFLAALDHALSQASHRVVAAYDRSLKWRERVRRALIALLSFLDENPYAARLMLVESLGAGPRALERRKRVLAQIVPAIDEGRSEARRAQDPPPLTAEGVLGGALSVLHGRITSGEDRPLLELAGSLTGMIVLPYQGAAAARAEISRAAPTAVSPSPRANGDNPLKELQMRLTYRTARVLSAIGANPGSSNRRLADIAEVSDQGQISKLLARLEKLGLVENAGSGATHGEPNAWRLTARGRDVQDVLMTQA